MSSLPPDPYRAPTQAPGGQPEILDSGHGAAVPPARRPRSSARKAVAAGAALVVVAALGVGGFAAWSAFFATGPQPAEALPDSTVGYLSLDLDPAGGQKLEARETLEKFPALDGKIDTDSEGSLRESLFERLQEAGACPDLDWGDDVDPWLGDRFAVAAVDLGKQDDESELGVTPVFVVQVKDADAAENGLEAVLECAIGGESADSGTGSDDSSDTFGWSIRGGWAVIAETDELAESVTDAAADAPLSGDDDFEKWTGEAGDHGVLTAYAAPEAGDLLAEAVTSSMLAPEPDHSYCSESSEPGDDVEPCDDSGDGGSDDETQEILKRYFEDFEGAGLQVRFADGGVEVESASSVDLLAATGYGNLVESEGGDDVVATLPDDTAAAIGVGFEPGWVEALLDSYESLLGTQMNFDDLLQTAEDELGLELPEDAEALLGESAALAIGPGFDPDGKDPSDVDVAVKIKGDPDRVAEVLEKLRRQPGVRRRPR